MGKLLSLGATLHYPILITQIKKSTGDRIKKQETLLEYTYEHEVEVGRGDLDEPTDLWKEKRTAYVNWESPVDGTILSLDINEGETVKGNLAFVEVEEDCAHDVQFGGLCVACGKDMTELTWASKTNDAQRATINLTHDNNFLKVSELEASKKGEELERRLLKERKLTLVIDLDQTLMQACVDPTVGEWQKDPTSPNYEVLKGVQSFQLGEENGARNSVSGCWYFIKTRPNLQQFLSKMAEMYELHVYTMGTRPYAKNIAKLIDPDKKFFGDRIISRDENLHGLHEKRLSRLFHNHTNMVAIIDDRADVWNRDRNNLIKVLPFEFWPGAGDINASFLPKVEAIFSPPRQPQIVQTLPSPPKNEPPAVTEAVVAAGSDKENPSTDSVKDSLATDTQPPEPIVPAVPHTEGAESKVPSEKEPANAGASDDQVLQVQAAEQEKVLQKQLDERPLETLQKQLDEEDNTTEQNGAPDHPHPRHKLLVDDDTELVYLENHLTKVYKAWYEQYDRALVNARGGRVAQLKPGHNKKIPIKHDMADLAIVPDIGTIMPRLKSKVLEGTTIVMSGLVPLTIDIMKSELAQQLINFGAIHQDKITRKTTHLVAPTAKTRTHKVRQAAKYPHIKIVTKQWLFDAFTKWEKPDESQYLVEIQEGDRLRRPSSADPSLDGSDSESYMESEPETDSIPASQEEEEEEDAEGVMPDSFEDAASPIDDLKTFDWGDADDELKDFLGSDDEANDSDTSTSSRTSTKSSRGKKRNHSDATGVEDEDDSDSSVTAKKARKSNSRSTGLKSMTQTAESSLPTPGPVDDDDDGWGDLEADLEAEFD